jgi:hypothetical protein
MTAIEFLFAVVSVANTMLLSLVWLELRNTRHTIAAQGSLRRQWRREEHSE